MTRMKTAKFNNAWVDIQFNQGEYRTAGQTTYFAGYELESGEGEFLQWQFDGQALTVKTSAFGLINAYYYQDNKRLIIATDIIDILKRVGKQPLDVDGLNSFMQLGYYLADQTPFKTIKCLARDSQITWDKSGLIVKDLQSLHIPKTYTGSYEQAMQEYLDLFAQVIAEFDTHNEKLALPLSGGRDSRHILLELMKQNKQVDLIATCACFPPKHNDDLAAAKNLCEALKVNHVTTPLGNDLFDDELEKNSMTSFCADEHAWMLPLHKYFSEQNISFIYDGIAGDVLSAGHFLSPDRIIWRKQENWVAIAEDITSKPPNYNKFLNKKLIPFMDRSKVVNQIAAELASLKEYENPIAEFYLRNRTRREIGLSTWNIMGEGRIAVAPFLLTRLYHFLTSLPFEYIEDTQFHTKAIKAGYPNAAAVPFSTGKKQLLPEYQDAIRQFNDKALKYIINSNSNKNILSRTQHWLKLIRMQVNKSYLNDRLDILNKAIYYTQLCEYTNEDK